MYGLGIAQPLRYPDSADLPDLQRCNSPKLLDGRSVLDKLLFQNEVQRVLSAPKLTLVAVLALGLESIELNFINC